VTTGDTAGRQPPDEVDARVGQWLDEGRALDAAAGLDAGRDQLLARLAAERGIGAWARSRTTAVRRGSWAVLLVVGAVAVSKRPDLAHYPLSYLAPAALAFAGLALWAALWALRPLHRPAPHRLQVGLLSAGLAVAPLVFALLPEAYGAAGASSPVPPEALPTAWECFIFGTLAGAPFAAVGWLLDRGGLVAGGRLLLMSLAAAAVGNLLLLLHCPNTDPVHLLAGHASVMVPPLGVAAFVAAWRRRAQRR